MSCIRFKVNMFVVTIWYFGFLFMIPFSNRIEFNINRPKDVKVSEKDAIKIRSFNLKDVKLLKSPFQHAMKMDEKYLLELNPDRLLAPFLKSAGLKPRAPDYGAWESHSTTGHTLGSYLSALSMMYAATGNSKLLNRVNYILNELSICQQAHGDGYVGPIPGGEKVWNEIKNGVINNNKGGHFILDGVGVPWYNLHKTFIGLRDAYRYTGNKKAEKILIRLADWAVNVCNHISDAQFDKMIRTEYGGMNEVMADIYAMTGKKKYLELAQRFNDKTVFKPLEKGIDSLNGLHVNTQIPKIIGAAREYEVDGSSQMKNVANYFWNEVTSKRIYINGEMGDNEFFGKLGQLPNRLGKAAGETCNVFNMLKLTRHLMEWEPNTQYVAYYERALYNDILASQDPKTGMMTYYMSMRPGFFKTFSQPFNSFWCCVCTGMENHAKYGKVIYMHGTKRLYVNLFIPSVLSWKQKGIKLVQETKFPYTQKSKLTLTMSHPENLVLEIRRPYWAGAGYSIRVNGKSIGKITKPGSYIAVKRTWHNGDHISISLPIKLHVYHMTNDSHKVAIMDGPILLAGALGGYIPFPYAGNNQRQFFNMPAISVPKLAIPDKPVDDWIKPIPGKALQFKTVGVGHPDDVKLIPFYQIVHQHYTIYWETDS